MARKMFIVASVCTLTFTSPCSPMGLWNKFYLFTSPVRQFFSGTLPPPRTSLEPTTGSPSPQRQLDSTQRRRKLWWRNAAYLGGAIALGGLNAWCIYNNYQATQAAKNATLADLNSQGSRISQQLTRAGWISFTVASVDLLIAFALLPGKSRPLQRVMRFFGYATPADAQKKSDDLLAAMEEEDRHQEQATAIEFQTLKELLHGPNTEATHQEETQGPPTNQAPPQESPQRPFTPQDSTAQLQADLKQTRQLFNQVVAMEANTLATTQRLAKKIDRLLDLRNNRTTSPPVDPSVSSPREASGLPRRNPKLRPRKRLTAAEKYRKIWWQNVGYTSGTFFISSLGIWCIYSGLH